jgi:hypothetical protein
MRSRRASREPGGPRSWKTLRDPTSRKGRNAFATWLAIQRFCPLKAIAVFGYSSIIA